MRLALFLDRQQAMAVRARQDGMASLFDLGGPSEAFLSAAKRIWPAPGLVDTRLS